MQATNPNFFGKVNYDHKLVYSIHHDLFDVPYDENRTLAPSWYNSPGTCLVLSARSQPLCIVPDLISPLRS